MGIGDWGLGIGDWGLGPIPNSQYPIPKPQTPIEKYFLYANYNNKILNIFIEIKFRLIYNLFIFPHHYLIVICRLLRILHLLNQYLL